MFGWQIVVNTKERTVLFADEAALRRGVHAIGRSIGAQAALFCLVDDHLHAVLDIWKRPLNAQDEALHQYWGRAVGTGRRWSGGGGPGDTPSVRLSTRGRRLFERFPDQSGMLAT